MVKVLDIAGLVPNAHLGEVNESVKDAIKSSKGENKCCYMIMCIVLLAIVGIVVNILL